MDADVSLSQLADIAGIEARYWDIHGTLHETSPETMRILLRSFGIEGSGDIGAQITHLAQAPWRRVLPPVVVVREPAAVEIPMRLPIDAPAAIRWSIRFESGGMLTGECRLDSLPIENTAEIDGRQIALRRLGLGRLPLGYHSFRLDEVETATRLIVAPARCHLPPQLAVRHIWGLAAQLYSIKSANDWGIGDFGSLRDLIDRVTPARAEAIGLNPLHALFLDCPEDASPYSPCSRLFRNPLYLDVTAVPEFAECDEARALVQGSTHGLQAARNAHYVDYKRVAALKLSVLERLHAQFLARHIPDADARADAFHDYVARRGEELDRFATFQVLSDHFQTHDWSRWPAACRDPRAVRLAEPRYIERLSFYKYLQWQCEEQLAVAADHAQSRGMAVGLYNDLAVSVDASSADHWGHQDLFAGALRVGAPPDPFNETGQEWGVVPLNPRRLHETGYAYFSALLRANMRHSGALRVDHVMGWQRLFLIPAGAPPAAGAYVRYPIEDFLAIAALESHRNRCLVIGEDLGTVPEGFRERMSEANVLSCRVFYFEGGHDRYRRPAEYPPLAAVSVSTHDLATLRGFWDGCDLSAKARLELFKSAEDEAAARAHRRAEKRRLLQGLADEGLLTPGMSPSDVDHVAWSPELSRAVHCYLARTPSALLLVQLDDLAGEPHQINLPGSTTQYPNWRRRFTRSLDELLTDPDVEQQMRAIAADRAK